MTPEDEPNIYCSSHKDSFVGGLGFVLYCAHLGVDADQDCEESIGILGVSGVDRVGFK